MADSKTDIINLAATYISEARAIDPETDTGETPRTLNFLYDHARKKVLRAHTWGCAKVDVQISSDSTAPLFKWARAYTLPVEWVRNVSISETDIDFIECPRYEIKGRKLLTDEASPLNLTYIQDLTNVGDMDDMLIEGIARRLAADACLARTDWLPLLDFLEQKYEVYIEEAKFTDTMERRRALPDGYVHSGWDTAHFGGGSP